MRESKLHLPWLQYLQKGIRNDKGDQLKIRVSPLYYQTGHPLCDQGKPAPQQSQHSLTPEAQVSLPWELLDTIFLQVFLYHNVTTVLRTPKVHGITNDGSHITEFMTPYSQAGGKIKIKIIDLGMHLISNKLSLWLELPST